jgi:hypothetical protein
MLNIALSIRQPWAWAILHAGKDIENRGWSTNFRGRFYLHAAKGMALTEYEEFIAFTQDRFSAPEVASPSREDLLFGGIIGEAELADCVREHASPWFVGKYGFVLRNAKPLPFRPLKGSLGFFVIEQEART